MTAPLADQLRKGDARALARALTVVENRGADAAALLAALGPPGSAHRVGVTGPPGAGKSTLASALATAWRRSGRRVGILAVDPSSPFTGGALLGDRVRMLQHAGDAEVFIRSLASRGAAGGLSAAVYDAADVLDAAGFDPVLIETVGVGQGEIEICRAADTTVLVLAPGAGDEVQGMKAGLIEAADVIVVNQADRDGAERLATSLRTALELRTTDRPQPHVVQTVASTGQGVDTLREFLDQRAGAIELDAGVGARRVERARARIRASIERRLMSQWWAGREDALEQAARAVAEGAVSTAGAVEQLMEGDA